MSLRDQYRKFLHKKTKSPIAATAQKPWRYESEMAFLKPFLRERESISNWSQDIPPQNSFLGEDEVDVEVEIIGTTPLTASPTTHCEDSYEPQECSLQEQQQQKQHKCKGKEQSASAVLLRHLLEIKEAEQKRPVDTFLASIGSVLKTFSPMRLVEAKQEINNIVTKYEREQITEDSSNTKMGQFVN